ncbi:MAG: Fis family transcriptional regulator [Bdellovibrionales bacterium CG10_big_fil_rev_8_21_14_0_10_45_34]|nr:MAG: Fis family transcriptional regulator [Bdellovibrionales bacterium CG10_big_fil_rev_8_21_14_0_10_45_34]
MHSEKNRIMIVDDEDAILSVLADHLLDEGFEVAKATNGEEALQLAKGFHPQVVLLDIWMPGRLDGIQVLGRLKSSHPNLECIMMSGHGTIETAVRATKMGAWDFVEKPISIERILILVSNILNYQKERDEKVSLLGRLRQSVAIVGESRFTIELKAKLAQLAPTRNPVCLVGEMGSGKRLVAQNLHYLGDRASQAYVEMPVQSVPTELQTIELFGADRGAVVGLQSVRKGLVELAHKGTLYIEDFDQLSEVALQMLADYAKTSTFQKVGATERQGVDTRIVVSTSLSREELQQKLHEHWVNIEPLLVNSVHLLPLRKRPEDIASLVMHFSDAFAKSSSFGLKTFDQPAMEKLRGYGWPGNILELRNFIERLYILIPGDEMKVEDLELAGLKDDQDINPLNAAFKAANFKLARAQFEREYIQRKLLENSGNVSRTAELIGLERSHLHRKIKAYGIEAKLDREGDRAPNAP